MVRIENKNEYKVGDEVWYFDTWGSLRHGIIEKIVGDKAATREGKRGGISAGSSLWNCWPTKEACLEAENKRWELQKAEYKESIKSVEDLVRFLYDHDINSEYADYEAREVAKECAAEFGISLE